MSQFSAVAWRVKPGSEGVVEELFGNSGRPEHVIRGENGDIKGKLLSTVVLMKDNLVVRVIEFEGSITDVQEHMGRQPEVRELERKLDPYLETPRDMTTPEGVREYFQQVSMRCILARTHDQ